MKKLAMFLLVLLAACSPSGPAVSQSGIEVFDSQVRVAGVGTDAVAAGYMRIKNTDSEMDQLIGASCDFADASLHETKLNGSTMTMDAVESVEIPAGALLELRSGSYHVMLINLKRELKTGEMVTITLEFKNAGQVSVPAQVGR